MEAPEQAEEALLPAEPPAAAALAAAQRAAPDKSVAVHQSADTAFPNCREHFAASNARTARWPATASPSCKTSQLGSPKHRFATPRRCPSPNVPRGFRM